MELFHNQHSMLGVKGFKNLGIRNRQHVVIKHVFGAYCIPQINKGTNTIKKHAFAMILPTIGISLLLEWVILQHTSKL